MTASEQAKAAGLKSLAQVSELTGVSFQTLNNWSKHKPDLFRVVLLGCAESGFIKKMEEAQEMIGDVRIEEFIHPDSISVTVYDVQVLSAAEGKYAEEGQTYWRSVTVEPIASKQIAMDLALQFAN
jgi:hypothetical protein